MTLTPPASPTPGIFHGLLTRAQLAAELGCHERTLARREREGMPHLRWGRKRLYDPSSIRAWVLSHESQPGGPKSRRR